MKFHKVGGKYYVRGKRRDEEYILAMVDTCPNRTEGEEITVCMALIGLHSGNRWSVSRSVTIQNTRSNEGNLFRPTDGGTWISETEFSKIAGTSNDRDWIPLYDLYVEEYEWEV